MGSVIADADFRRYLPLLVNARSVTDSTERLKISPLALFCLTDDSWTDGAICHITFGKGRIVLKTVEPDTGKAITVVLEDEAGLERLVILDGLAAEAAGTTPALLDPERLLIEYQAWSRYPEYWRRPAEQVEQIKAHVAAKVKAFEEQLVAAARDPVSAPLYEIRKLDSENPDNERFKRKPDALLEEWARFDRTWEQLTPLELPPLPAEANETASPAEE